LHALSASCAGTAVDRHVAGTAFFVAKLASTVVHHLKILYESRSRSLRIRGVVTTLRLENQFWDILTEIAAADSVSTNQLIAKLYEEVMDYRGEVVNFASFLRVSCTRYLSQKQVTNRVVPLSIAAG